MRRSPALSSSQYSEQARREFASSISSGGDTDDDCHCRRHRQAIAIAQHWIDGRWRDSAKHKDSINPATGEVIGRYAVAGEDEAREAVAAALRTFRETNWKNDRALRARVLNEMAARFEAHSAELIQLVSLEIGKVAPEAAFEVSLAASGLRYYGALVLTEYGRAAEWEPGHFSLLVREPIGVAGISVPWNSPVALLIRALAPALAAGCTTVVKMPGQTAQVNALLSQMISEVAGLPSGVVNILTGEREVLSFLVTPPTCRRSASRAARRSDGRSAGRCGAPEALRAGVGRQDTDAGVRRRRHGSGAPEAREGRHRVRRPVLHDRQPAARSIGIAARVRHNSRSVSRTSRWDPRRIRPATWVR